MGRSKRSSPRGGDRAEQWLGPDQPPRSRPWAYEELLLGTPDEAEELSALAADLAADLAELRRMQAELHEEVVRVAGLEGRVRALLRATGGDRVVRQEDLEGEHEPAAEIRSFPSAAERSPAALARDRALAHCEGFRVESPAGAVGYVEGLRFQSRIDKPDLLEVRGGRFGRELMLVPIEAVDEISVPEELVVVHGVPAMEGDHLHELMERVRRALSVRHAATQAGLTSGEDTLS